MSNKLDQQKIDAARKLYIKYRGRHHRHIESEMRGLGFTRFSRRVFYNSIKNGRLHSGWITRFGWKDEITQVKNSPPYEGGVAAASADGVVLSSDPHSEDPFEQWLRSVSPGMTWHWRHQRHLYEKLRAVTEGRVKRLMIFMPPRHGKSELVTVRYAAYRLQQDPSLNIILGSYNQRLANRFSRKIRSVWEDALLLDAKAQQTDERSAQSSPTYEGGVAAALGGRGGSFNQDVANDSPATGFSFSPSRRTRINTAAEWETGGGGGVRAVGVGAGITGFGAKLVIIDDPVKSRAEAESPTYRERVFEWFNDDVYTRLEPDAAVILIQTRWHEDDLAGRLIKEAKDGGEQWEMVCLPALAEPSEIENGKLRTENEEPESGNPFSILNSQFSIQVPTL